ncbi:MAG: ABC transporter ATP-binding protein [Actinomycetota bacterium]
MQNAIIVEGLGKEFSRYSTQRPYTIMEAALAGWRHMKPKTKFWALRDISFTVAPGKMLGIVGKNGAGKSTLLQLIGGVGRANEGRVKVKGRIGALLDLGVGFHYELTGRENVFVAGVVAGLTRKEVARRFDEIVEFAELGKSIDNPVRTYSSGMQMRLGFAVAVHTDPDILLIDEFLSVGDLAFQSKCLERIAEFKAKGCAIILISHKANQIEEFCDEALWLQQGRIFAQGDPKTIVREYIAQMRSETEQRTTQLPPSLRKSGAELRINENRLGSLEVEITAVQLLPASEINSGEPLQVKICYRSEQAVYAPAFRVSLTTEEGQTLFQTDIETKEQLPVLKGEGQIELVISRLDLGSGKYFVNVGVYEQNWAYAYDYHSNLYPLQVRSVANQPILCPPYRWELGSVQVKEQQY